MMSAVYLHGALGKQFGRRFEFDIQTAQEALQALRVNFPKFANAIRHGLYRVIIGENAKTGLALDETEVPGFKMGKQPLHIIPVAKGRKNGGIGKIITGIALIGLSLIPGMAAPIFAGVAGSATWAGAASSIGLGLAVNGVASLLAPEQESGDTRQSYTMTGPTSNIREGNILPIAYGLCVIGGYMISGGVVVEASAGGGSHVGPVEPTQNMIGGSLAGQQTPGGSGPPEA
ncbi:tail assembly protein [Paracoccus yeei]|uniref:Tail assembly protein n=1 Tax=Paracoccus yeei TaxID=147645 RepID=A0A5P2QRL1_9RHOB|nr:tail assembly protein [Paracoccus yeei]QEU08697.1 tail assembly protein [Paracoccus yeei]